MKKTTLAVATLLTALSAATIVPVAYADDSATTPMSSCTGCSACKANCAGCKGCKGCKGCSGCKGSSTGSDS